MQIVIAKRKKMNNDNNIIILVICKSIALILCLNLIELNLDIWMWNNP